MWPVHSGWRVDVAVVGPEYLYQGLGKYVASRKLMVASSSGLAVDPSDDPGSSGEASAEAVGVT